MKLIVGLGNPGPTYDGTRHNLGFDVVDTLANRLRIDMTREKFHAWFGDGRASEQKVLLLKPTTFMNRSGQAVAAAAKFYNLPFEDLLVVCDDTALPLGHVRLRAQGSAGSHNGLQDVIDRLGTRKFPRLRLGIDRPYRALADYVTSRFAPGERPEAEALVAVGAEVAEYWLAFGTQSAMNKYNRRARDGQEDET